MIGGAIGVALIGVLAVIVVKHSDSEKLLNGNGDALVLVGEKTNAGMMALTSGVLTDVGGCVGIGPENGALDDSAVVIWPHGTTVTVPEPLTIRVGGKDYEMGDQIEIGGGFTGPLKKSNFFYNQVPEACRTANVFLSHLG